MSSKNMNFTSGGQNKLFNGRGFELECLFRSGILNVNQIEHIIQWCRLLGKHMILDWELIQRLSNEKHGYTIMKKKAVNYNIITEIQYIDANDKPREDGPFFYYLGPGGYSLLERAFESYNKIDIFADKKTKEQILAFNYFALENNLELTYDQDAKHRFYNCTDSNGKVICHFKDVMSEMEIIRMLISARAPSREALKQEPETPKDIRKEYRFLNIDYKPIDIGSKSARSRNDNEQAKSVSRG